MFGRSPFRPRVSVVGYSFLPAHLCRRHFLCTSYPPPPPLNAGVRDRPPDRDDSFRRRDPRGGPSGRETAASSSRLTNPWIMGLFSAVHEVSIIIVISVLFLLAPPCLAGGQEDGYAVLLYFP